MLSGLWAITKLTIMEAIRIVVGVMLALCGLDIILLKSAIQAWLCEHLQLLGSKAGVVLISPCF